MEILKGYGKGSLTLWPQEEVLSAELLLCQEKHICCLYTERKKLHVKGHDKHKSL